MGFALTPVRVKKWGSSYAVVIPRNLREDLSIHEGDILAIRVHPPYATFCVWPANRVVPMEDVTKDVLPPLEPSKVKRG